MAQQLQVKLWEKLSRFQWMPFEEAREYVHGLNLKNVREWEEKNFKIPDNIPKSPAYQYKVSGWLSWGDWLGNGLISDNKKEWLKYDDAKSFVHTLNLKSEKFFKYVQYSTGEISYLASCTRKPY